jgi:hypothetical protein
MDSSACLTTGILYTDPGISSPPITLVKIHPLVIFQMVEAYERRVDPNLAIGLIFGSYHESEAVVLDCCPCLPHPRDVVDKALETQLYREHCQLYPNEQVLGYFSFSHTRTDWQGVLAEGHHGIHIWMRPAVPPKLDVLIIKLNQSVVISSPVEYEIDASASEQLGLSRLADHSSQGSLQAAVHELVALLKQMQEVCRSKSTSLARDKLVGRAIYRALQQTNLTATSAAVLEQAKHDIDHFITELERADGVIVRAEEQLSIPFD